MFVFCLACGTATAAARGGEVKGKLISQQGKILYILMDNT